jgi:hypothetical protein
MPNPSLRAKRSNPGDVSAKNHFASACCTVVSGLLRRYAPRNDGELGVFNSLLEPDVVPCVLETPTIDANETAVARLFDVFKIVLRCQKRVQTDMIKSIESADLLLFF